MMKKLVLFSSPYDEVIAKIEKYIFPKVSNKVFAFMPCDGVENCDPSLVEEWRNLAEIKLLIN